MALGSATDRSTDMGQSGSFGSAGYDEFCQRWELSVEVGSDFFEPGQFGYWGRTDGRQMGAEIEQFLLQSCARLKEVVKSSVSF